MNHILEPLMFGPGNEQSFNTIPGGLEMEMKPDRVLIAATETGVILPGNGCWYLLVRIYWWGH